MRVPPLCESVLVRGRKGPVYTEEATRHRCPCRSRWKGLSGLWNHQVSLYPGQHEWVRGQRRGALGETESCD